MLTFCDMEEGQLISIKVCSHKVLNFLLVFGLHTKPTCLRPTSTSEKEACGVYTRCELEPHRHLWTMSKFWTISCHVMEIETLKGNSDYVLEF